MSEDANTRALVETRLHLGRRIGELEEALLQMRGYLKLWSDDADAGLMPTHGSLSDARHLIDMTLKGGE